MSDAIIIDVRTPIEKHRDKAMESVAKQMFPRPMKLELPWSKERAREVEVKPAEDGLAYWIAHK